MTSTSAYCRPCEEIRPTDQPRKTWHRGEIAETRTGFALVCARCDGVFLTVDGPRRRVLLNRLQVGTIGGMTVATFASMLSRDGWSIAIGASLLLAAALLSIFVPLNALLRWLKKPRAGA